MALKGLEVRLDSIGIEPGSVFFRNMSIKLKNGLEWRLNPRGYDVLPVKFDGLSSQRISKVAFQMVNYRPGIQYTCGLRL